MKGDDDVQVILGWFRSLVLEGVEYLVQFQMVRVYTELVAAGSSDHAVAEYLANEGKVRELASPHLPVTGAEQRATSRAWSFPEPAVLVEGTTPPLHEFSGGQGGVSAPEEIVDVSLDVLGRLVWCCDHVAFPHRTR